MARQSLSGIAAVVKKDRTLKKVLYSVTLERYVPAMLPNWGLRNRKAGRTPALRFCERPGLRLAFCFEALTHRHSGEPSPFVTPAEAGVQLSKFAK